MLFLIGCNEQQKNTDLKKVVGVDRKDTISVNVLGQSKPASFNEKYINKNKGKYRVLLPEVHELVNIAVALTDIGKKDSNMVYMQSDYYNRVITHFDKFKHLPFIDSLNQNITEVFGNSTYDYYYNIRMNACMYSFEGGKIVNKSKYHQGIAKIEDRINCQSLISISCQNKR